MSKFTVMHIIACSFLALAGLYPVACYILYRNIITPRLLRTGLAHNRRAIQKQLIVLAVESSLTCMGWAGAWYFLSLVETADPNSSVVWMVAGMLCIVGMSVAFLMGAMTAGKIRAMQTIGSASDSTI